MNKDKKEYDIVNNYVKNNLEEIKILVNSVHIDECAKQFNISKYRFLKILRENNIEIDKKNKKDLANKKRIITCQKLYGCSNVSQNENVREKYNETILNRTQEQRDKINDTRKQTCLKNYGYEFILQVPQIKNKFSQTYSNKTYKEKEKIKKKRANTNLKNFGVSCSCQSEEAKIKSKKTCLEKYNYDHFSKSPQGKEKIKLGHSLRTKDQIKESVLKSQKTKLEKWGDPNYTNREKCKKTCLQHFGVTSYSQTEEYHHKKYKKYFYDNEYFDSSYELAFYKFYKDKNINIIHEPCKFEYYFNNKKHYYFPDFKVNNELIEIKGEQFFENGKLINPYNRQLDDLCEAKHQCMIQNNVKIITDCSIYLSKISKDFINKCRIKG